MSCEESRRDRQHYGARHPATDTPYEPPLRVRMDNRQGAGKCLKTAEFPLAQTGLRLLRLALAGRKIPDFPDENHN